MRELIIRIISLILILLDANYNKLLINTKIPAITNSSNYSDFTIYRTSNTRLVNKKMYDNSYHRWIELNNNISMIWYDDSDMDDYMKKQDKDIYLAYQRLLPGAFKGDLFRLCILYEQGGIYVDDQTLPYVSIDEMLYGCIDKSNSHYFVSVLDTNQSGRGIHNGFICCSPKHPFIKKCIELIIINVDRKRYTMSPLTITGPLCLSKAINTMLGRKNYDKFIEGKNEYGEMSFYLYSLSYGPFQYIYKNNKIIMSKKHCLLSCFLSKIKSTSYRNMWLNNKVYDLKFY